MDEEDWGLKVARIVADIVAGHTVLAVGIITAYRAGTHRAQVQIQPDGPTVDVQIGTPYLGLTHPIRPGTQCLVAHVDNHPVGVLCVLHSDAVEDAVPAPAQVIEGDTFTNGVATVTGGVRLPPALVLPAPTEEDRGTVRSVGTAAGGLPGAADGLYWCQQQTDGTLAWIQVA